LQPASSTSDSETSTLTNFFQHFPQELSFNILMHVTTHLCKHIGKKFFGNNLVGRLAKYLIKCPYYSSPPMIWALPPVVGALLHPNRTLVSSCILDLMASAIVDRHYLHRLNCMINCTRQQFKH